MFSSATSCFAVAVRGTIFLNSLHPRRKIGYATLSNAPAANRCDNAGIRNGFDLQDLARIDNAVQIIL